VSSFLIRRGGQIPWPPRSPDFSPVDFFSVISFILMLGCSKKVYSGADLQQRITVSHYCVLVVCLGLDRNGILFLHIQSCHWCPNLAVLSCN